MHQVLSFKCLLCTIWHQILVDVGVFKFPGHFSWQWLLLFFFFFVFIWMPHKLPQFPTLHTLRFNLKWLRLLSDEFCLKSVTLAMQSAIVPKQLAKNVTLILHPWFQVVRRASISAFFSCQRIHCGCNVPAVSCSYYMQTQSLAGKINSEKQLLCTDSQAGTALFLSLLASCFHTFSYFFSSLFNIICLTIQWVKHLWPLNRIPFHSMIPISSFITRFYILFILSFIILSRIRWPLIGYLWTFLFFMNGRYIIHSFGVEKAIYANEEL